MTSKTIGFGVLAVLAGLMGWGLFLQRETNMRVRAELESLRAEERELAALRAEQHRLEAAALPAADLQQLRGDRAALGRLRAEIEALKRSGQLAPAPSAAPERSTALARRVPAGELRNAGRATPAAAVETALWSAAKGDIETFALSISLSETARAKAEAILAGLSDAARLEYGSPERLVAICTAKEMRLLSAYFRKETEKGADDVILSVSLLSVGPDPFLKSNGRVETETLKEFTLHRDAAGWKLVVPESAVVKYAAVLKPAVRPK